MSTPPNPSISLILASASPRRRELLASTGIAFQVVPASIDERPHPGEVPDAYVRRLALAKAEIVAEHSLGAVVLGADTTVTIDQLLLGKPSSAEEAREMLCRLSGRVHQVVTGVAIVRVDPAGRRHEQPLV
ncbi:MAG: Maf family protein, partial [Candidatus Entotheonellia bacterium]